MMDRIERIKQSFDIQHIEHNDTHDYIQHHDPDHFKNKDNKSSNEAKHDEDLTDISVESLILFLEGLKKNNTPRSLSHNTKTTDQTMKKAIDAYAHTAPDPKKRYTYLDEGKQNIDTNLVEGLIHDLQDFINNDIAHITLLPAKGFLESIEITVEKIRSI